jgi:hypothetical protein
VNHPKPRTGVCRMHQGDAVNHNKFAERNLIKFSASRGVCSRTAALFGPAHVIFFPHVWFQFMYPKKCAWNLNAVKKNDSESCFKLNIFFRASLFVP